jgi:hypothetical protein
MKGSFSSEKKDTAEIETTQGNNPYKAAACTVHRQIVVGSAVRQCKGGPLAQSVMAITDQLVEKSRYILQTR